MAAKETKEAPLVARRVVDGAFGRQERAIGAAPTDGAGTEGAAPTGSPELDFFAGLGRRDASAARRSCWLCSVISSFLFHLEFAVFANQFELGFTFAAGYSAELDFDQVGPVLLDHVGPAIVRCGRPEFEPLAIVVGDDDLGDAVEAVGQILGRWSRRS